MMQATRLIQEKSPYLLQHAYNPVDWYPWGEEAFEKAKSENKPVFLSIGYSTCHWCHVMEKESFEDQEIAALLNKVFVCIKVDREERPDIDSVYMSVCHLMNGSGGWPLTILLTPEKKPFFAGTYFPKKTQYGRMGMVELISSIEYLWQEKKDKIDQNVDQILEALSSISSLAVTAEISDHLLEKAFTGFTKSFDEKWGGFGFSPKFPTPHHFFFLLRYWKKHKQEKALEMTEKTLQAMRSGGIYDHIGFGFHRYSTDAKWVVPHFEKMLYDQALLVMAYIETYQATQKAEYLQTAEEILEYCFRDMKSEKGGFFSAEDADSEGKEGQFYLWSKEELEALLEKEEFSLLEQKFQITQKGNFPEIPGTNILHHVPKNTPKTIEEIRQKLFAKRKERIHPHKDDKILTDWNGLMLSALSRAFQVTQNPKYSLAAKDLAQFFLHTMKKEDGGLYHRYRDGSKDIPGFLDDYSFLISGLLDLYEATFDIVYIEEAISLNQYLLQHFWDKDQGGFYFSADNSEIVLMRRKEIYDGAIPSGNSVALHNLIRLFHITGDASFQDYSQKLIDAFSYAIQETPMAYTYFLSALDFAFGPSCEIIISPATSKQETQRAIQSIFSCFLPSKVLLLVPEEKTEKNIRDFQPYILANATKEKNLVYICKNQTCSPPISSIEDLEIALKCL
ncbi:MAG: thioredoxin domain-containing protein [Candidatus Brocadiae bacterium]|nr:thioredoxin domain-containing protein [Candidatus Brocadiia bacterium]